MSVSDCELKARSRPNVWATTPAKLMAGDQQCQFAAYLKAKFRVPKRPSDFDLATWTAQHNALVQAKAEALSAEGYEVFLEGQNAFQLVGKTGAVLAGRPDIVAVKGDEARVIDCKTGQPRAGDHYQVLLYMYVLPKSHEACKGKAVSGEVMYTNGVVDIPPEAVDEAFVAQFGATMQRILADEPPLAAPSYHECRFCDIGKAHCPYRVDTPPPEVKSDLF